MTERDMTERQFQDAAKKSGFLAEGFGWWKLAAPCNHTSVNRYNGGSRRRSQLAWLCAEQAKAEAEQEKKQLEGLKGFAV